MARHFGQCIALLIAATYGQHMSAADSEIAARFLREYPGACNRLEEKLNRVDMTFSLNRAGGIVERQHYSANNGLLRWDQEIPEKGPVSWVFDGQRLWAVHKPTDRSDYQLVTMRNHATPEGLETFRVKTRYPFAPYCIFEKRISDFIAEPGFRITEAKLLAQDARTLAEIKWENAHLVEQGQKKVRFGSFLFDPDKDWLLLGYEFGFDKNLPEFRRATIKYEIDSSGTPLIAQLEEVQSRDGKISPIENVQTGSAVVHDVPESEFKLSAFGIPDDVGQLSAHSSSHWKLVLLVNIALFSVAVALYLFSRHWSNRSAKGLLK